MDSQSTKYQRENTIKFETETIKSNLCNSSDAYILVTGDIRCIAHVNNIFTDKAENIGNIISMHNLIEHNDNYSDISRSVWSFKRAKVPANNAVLNINGSTSFKYKLSLLGIQQQKVQMERSQIQN